MDTCKGVGSIYRGKLYLFIYYPLLSYHRAEASIQANYSSFYNKFKILNYPIKPLLHLVCQRLLMVDIVCHYLLMSDIVCHYLLMADIVCHYLLMSDIVCHYLLMSDIVSSRLLMSDIISSRLLMRSTVNHY